MGPDSAAVPRQRLVAAVVCALALGAAGLHHLTRAALPFPLDERLFAAGGAVAGLLAALRVGGAIRAGGALLALGLLLVGGLPAAHNATLPFVELGRCWDFDHEDLTILGLACGIVATTVASEQRWFARIAALVATAALAVNLFLPGKATLQALEVPSPGMTTVPILGWSDPTPVRWSRERGEGTFIGLFPEMVKQEWTVIVLAGGIHQEAAKASPGVATTIRSGVRWVAWRTLEGVAAGELVLRVLALPAAAIVLVGTFRTAGGRAFCGARAALRAALWLVPLANLGALAVGLLVLLPDDADLRLPALGSTLLTLLVCRLVDPGGRA